LKKVYIDGCSGIGGFILAALRAGFRLDKHYFSEIDPYAVKLYQKRFPNAISLGDMKNIDWKNLRKEQGEPADFLFTSGFP
jgi:DNA (cytosine-5)-methyltransferase 1